MNISFLSRLSDFKTYNICDIKTGAGKVGGRGAANRAERGIQQGHR